MISRYRAKQLLEYEFGKREFEPTDRLYIGLSSSNPIEMVAEPDESVGYSRCAIDNTYGAGVWSSVGESIKVDGDITKQLGSFSLANKIAFTFGMLTGTFADSVTYWFISDAAVGGNILYYGQLVQPYDMVQDSQIIIPPGEMIITRTNEQTCRYRGVFMRIEPKERIKIYTDASILKQTIQFYIHDSLKRISICCDSIKRIPVYCDSIKRVPIYIDSLKRMPVYVDNFVNHLASPYLTELYHTDITEVSIRSKQTRVYRLDDINDLMLDNVNNKTLSQISYEEVD